jgi:holo-[acyl-carrier protein] synthase
MIAGIGTDIIEISRIEKAIEKYGERFLKRIFTDTERNYCEQFGDTKYLHYAARFAAKESFSKAIGTGITEGFKFSEVGVRNEPNGKPLIELSGGLARQWESYNVLISLSHTDRNAMAYCVIEKR